MKTLYEVKVTYTALVLAGPDEDVEEIARAELDEITSYENHPEIECGVSFRSRQELEAYAELEGSGWDHGCFPYGGDGITHIGAVLDDIEAADLAEAEALAYRCLKTVDMFEEPKPVMAPEPARPPDFRLMVARKFANQGDDWNWCRMEYIGEGEGAGALIEGGLPNIDCRGKQRWTGVRLDKLFVSEAQVASAALAWERETGKCHVCAGSGQENIGWHHKDGNKYRTCTRCNGEGTPTELLEQSA